MRKLHLDLDALAVESFDAAPNESSAAGTVRGHDQILMSARKPCSPITVPGCALSDDDPTCQISCGQIGSCTYTDP